MIYTGIGTLYSILKFCDVGNRYTIFYENTIRRIYINVIRKSLDACKKYIRVLIMIYTLPTLMCYYWVWTLFGFYENTKISVLGIFAMIAVYGFISEKQFNAIRDFWADAFYYGIIGLVGLTVILGYPSSDKSFFNQLKPIVLILFNFFAMMLFINWINLHLSNYLVTQLKKLAVHSLSKRDKIVKSLVVLDLVFVSGITWFVSGINFLVNSNFFLS